MKRMNLENEYNNRQRVPDHGVFAERWMTAGAAFRDAAADHCELDIAYGDSDRQAYDLFHPVSGAETTPLVAYIHGGYWQRGDRKDYSCVAEALTEHGMSVAIPSYSLCPDVSVMDIVAEMASFTAHVYRKTNKRPVMVGHSAGGHLASAMLATDWASHDGVPPDVVRRAYAISGVFNLRPLIRTSLNDALNLDREAADAASTALWAPPPAGRRLVAAVGALESREFMRQSLELVARWGDAGVTAECVAIPDANHFSVVDHLLKPGSGMFERVVEFARAEAADTASA
ncbi:MAG: alpha/beta hydrolase [Pseudomonadota bacterium]